MSTYERVMREQMAQEAHRYAAEGAMDIKTWAEMVDEYAVANGYADVEKVYTTSTAAFGGQYMEERAPAAFGGVYHRAVLVRSDGHRVRVWCRMKNDGYSADEVEWYVAHA